jgi:argininosuccinate lyase
MDSKFYNLLDYLKSVSIAKKMVQQNILTQEESQQILQRLKQYYKINENIDD